MKGSGRGDAEVRFAPGLAAWAAHTAGTLQTEGHFHGHDRQTHHDESSMAPEW